MLNFRVMNASSFIPVDATSGNGVSTHCETGANTPTGFILQPTSASAFVAVSNGQLAAVGVTNKSGKLTGREKGAFAYGVDEHVALFSFFQVVPNSFNESKFT